MHDIDFLPAEYQQRHARRRKLLWRNVVSVVACFVVAAAAIYQQHTRRGLLAQLASVNPQHDWACSQTDQLSQLQAELKDAQADAELITYLEHPWPRTQIIAELLRPLPEEIVFTSLQIGQQPPPNDPNAIKAARVEKRKEGATAKELPSVADLKKLREEMDRMQTVVTLEGTTTDSDALHRYIGQLNEASFFSNAELESLEAGRSGEKSSVHFVATLLVEPAYGVPGGPTGPPASAMAGVESTAVSVESPQAPPPAKPLRGRFKTRSEPEKPVASGQL